MARCLARALLPCSLALLACAHEAAPMSPHRRGDGRFANPEPTGMLTGGAARMTGRWLTERAEREPDRPLPFRRVEPAALAGPAAGLRVWWLGHDTFLVEIDGRRVLTDPALGERSSPVSFAGPRRFLPAPIAAADLPPLDAVVVSHNHYDHLDEATVRTLAKGGAPFHVPLGLGRLLRGWGVERVVEQDWWQAQSPCEGLVLTAAPARHFSGRGMLDRDRTQWASWALAGPRRRVYFGGDTGFFAGFAEIGERLGPFDVALLPVGAYDAAWAHIHLDPEQAVRAHQALRAGLLVPGHWATFNLAFHAWHEPGERLLAAAAAAGVRLALPLAGEPLDPASPPTEPWWRPSMRARP